MRLVFIAVSLALALTVVAVVAALAQTTGGPTLASTVISVNDLLAPWLPILMAAFMGVVIALLTWIKSWIERRTNITIENVHMQTLQKAVENAAGLVLSKITTGAKTITVDVGSDAVRQGVSYVNQSAADAVAKFGLSSDQIAEKIIAKLGVITAPNPETNIRDVTPPPPNPGAGG